MFRASPWIFGGLVLATLLGCLLAFRLGDGGTVPTLAADRALRRMGMAAYSGYRDLRQWTGLRAYTAAGAADGGLYLHRSGDRFDVFAETAEPAVAELVLQVAEAIYGPVTELLGTAAPGRIPVVVHADHEGLRRAFGWGQGEKAAGAYYGGIIRVVAPAAPHPGQDVTAWAKAYARLSPLAHEFTHYLLDYRADGNYSRWFSEGLAQWVEYRVTGYRWPGAGVRIAGTPYDYADLDRRFPSLKNQTLAYRQALELVETLVQACGEAAPRRLVARLGGGTAFGPALVQTCGLTPRGLHDRWAATAAAGSHRSVGRAGEGPGTAEDSP